MGRVMNMDSYENECDSTEDEYGEEVAYSGWNPAVTLVCQQQLAIPTNRLAVMPIDCGMGDAELFLQ